VRLDVAEDHLSRRSSSAWAKSADAVFRISFTRRSSATSRRSAFTSSDTSVGARPGAGVDLLALDPVAQRRRIDVQHRADLTAGGQLRLAEITDPVLIFRTARARISSSNLRGAATGSVSLRDQNLHQIQDDSLAEVAADAERLVQVSW
jgi:hypothetical protein